MVDFHDIPHEFVKAQMVSKGLLSDRECTDMFLSLQGAGLDVPSFTSLHLEGNPTPAEEDVIKAAAGSIFAGGSDTVSILSAMPSYQFITECYLQTVSATHSFYLAMTLYPEVQAKAQEELDRVIGSDRCVGQLQYSPTLTKLVL